MKIKPNSECKKRQLSKPYRWETLTKWVKEYGWKEGLELGVYEGKTFLYLLEHCPKLIMHGVDSWESDLSKCGTEDFGGCAHIAKDMKEVYRKLKNSAQALGPDRFCLHQYKTQEATFLFRDESLDFIFIDASHLYEDVKQDIITYIPKLKPSGMLIGHDIWMGGVEAAVAELLPGWKETTDHVWYIPRSEIHVI